jgi:hypothetical protein
MWGRHGRRRRRSEHVERCVSLRVIDPRYPATSLDTYGACDLLMITLPLTLTTVDLQHGYRSVRLGVERELLAPFAAPDSAGYALPLSPASSQRLRPSHGVVAIPHHRNVGAPPIPPLGESGIGGVASEVVE